MSRAGRPVFISDRDEVGDDMAQTEPTVAASPMLVTMTQEQLNQLLAAASGGNQAGFTAEALAKAFSKAQRPENPQAPMISHLNPRGETEHPRPAFKAKKVAQNGMDLRTDDLSWEEIEGINALKPGEFRVMKADNSKTTFRVEFTRGVDGETLDRLDFHFPCKNEQREGHRALFEYLVEAVRQGAGDDEAERLLALQRQLNKERAALKLS